MRRPELRNRNIGTASSGFKHRNIMAIPESVLDRLGKDSRYYERVKLDHVHHFEIGTNELTVLYENLRPGYSYGCTPADVAHLISLLPEEDVAGIDLISFRQPTRKQVQQSPVWGRFIYYATIGSYEGRCVNLEAFDVSKTIEWPRKLSVESQAELERLKKDGHLHEETRRSHRLTVTETSLRNHILYRTLLHEIGHWVDYDSKINRPNDRLDEDWDRAFDLYFSRPSAEREAFAHRYAVEQSAKLRLDKKIPFDRISD